MVGSITVTIARKAAQDRRSEMVAWMQAGIRLASDWPGFLGAGWVRPNQDSDEWHLLYRFASEAELDAWQTSSQRAWWLSAGESFVEETRTEHRTGIEGWFDPPAAYSIDAVESRPPRWKQAVTIFLVFFPVSLLANLALGPWVGHWALPLRLLATMVVTVPFMTYVGLPWITSQMAWFLRGRRRVGR